MMTTPHQRWRNGRSCRGAARLHPDLHEGLHGAPTVAICRRHKPAPGEARVTCDIPVRSRTLSPRNRRWIAYAVCPRIDQSSAHPASHAPSSRGPARMVCLHRLLLDQRHDHSVLRHVRRPQTLQRGHRHVRRRVHHRRGPRRAPQRRGRRSGRRGRAMPPLPRLRESAHHTLACGARKALQLLCQPRRGVLRRRDDHPTSRRPR